jgi:hypothetical protein
LPEHELKFDSHEDEEEEEDRLNEEDDEDERLSRQEQKDDEEEEDIHSDDMRAFDLTPLPEQAVSRIQKL